MTYTVHRDTQSTLSILDNLDLDADKPTDEELARKFGVLEQYMAGKMTCWQRVKPRIWLLFDEPASSIAAKVGGILFYKHPNSICEFFSDTVTALYTAFLWKNVHTAFFFYC